MKLIYVAHQFGGNPTNLDRAEAWVAWLCSRFDALFWAPWIPLCRHWPDSGDTRKRGLELDLLAIERSDGIITVGGQMSPGMYIERDHAAAHGVSLWDVSDFATPEELAASGDGYEFDALHGWIRELTNE
jgi:hypothetical protein